MHYYNYERQNNHRKIGQKIKQLSITLIKFTIYSNKMIIDSRRTFSRQGMMTPH